MNETHIISSEADFRRLIKEYPDSTKAQVTRAAATTLTRIAARGRRDQQSAMPRFIHRPVAFTRRSVLFEPAKASVGLARMSSAIFIRKEASDYLKNIVSGGRITELNERSPVLVPVIGSLTNPRVTRKIGKVFNIAGNIIRLKDARIKKIIDHPDTFVDEIGEDGKDPGIYLRLTTGRGRRAVSRIVTLFTFEKSVNRVATYPFSSIGLQTYRTNIVSIWQEEIQK